MCIRDRAYVVETFGRPQVVIVDVSAYERLLTYRAQRESFFEQLLAAGEENDPLNCDPVSYTHLRAHETVLDIVCRLLLEKKKQPNNTSNFA